MQDATGNVLYIGKARNLRQRLRNYRVANPERMARRHQVHKTLIPLFHFHNPPMPEE
jgi:excinuclease UvrABC nuclease subunit